MTGRARRQQRKRARRLAARLRWRVSDFSDFFAPLSSMKDVRAMLIRRFFTGGAYLPFERLEADVGFGIKSFLLHRSMVPGS